MKIAIVGAGFCGLAVAWNLLNQFSHFPELEVTLFDSKKIGGGTSGIAAGLLHPYVGAHAKLNWRGHEGIEATLYLLSIATKALKKPVIADNKGILRLAITPTQQQDFQKSPALAHPDVAWLDENQCQEMVPGCVKSPALWLKKGITVSCADYLEGLWLACEQKGAKFQQHHLSSLSQLDHFSTIIIAAGALSASIEGVANIPLKVVKGQVLEMSWPPSLSPLPLALNSQAYIVRKPRGESCLVGASYEKIFNDDGVNLERAIDEILPKALLLLPLLRESKIIRAYAGLRAVSPNHLPFFKKINEKSWIISGMGSKGLLYHALMAKELVEALAGTLAI